LAGNAGWGSLGPVIDRPALPGNGTDWLGQYGETYVDTIALAAGVTPATPRPDVVGIDRLFVDPRSGEIIRIQVKTTESPRRVASGDYAFDLDVPTFRKLRMGPTRAFLALVVLRDPHPRWSAHLRRGTLIRASCFTASITAMEETTNEGTVSVSLPLGNLLTPGSLLGLFTPETPEGAVHG
jgi:hypothetical protein